MGLLGSPQSSQAARRRSTATPGLLEECLCTSSDDSSGRSKEEEQEVEAGKLGCSRQKAVVELDDVIVPAPPPRPQNQQTTAEVARLRSALQKAEKERDYYQQQYFQYLVLSLKLALAHIDEAETDAAKEDTAPSTNELWESVQRQRVPEPQWESWLAQQLQCARK